MDLGGNGYLVIQIGDTQMVWEDTVVIGCAWKDCLSGLTLVCDYNGSGNTEGPPYAVP